MELAIFALLLALFENAYPTSTELQSLLIFTTATAKDREMEELRGKWSNLASFKSAYSSLVNVGFDQENYWTILLSRGEPDALFNDIQKAIQADDRTKVIVGRPNGIIDRIFLSPFCWRRGATDQMAFVMCNGKLEFAIDERGWEIDEKLEVNGGGMKGADMAAEMQRKSVWIDLLPGVRMATASPLQKKSKEAEDEEKMSKKRNGKKKAAKMEEENVKESEEDERKDDEDDKEPKEAEKVEEKTKDDEEEEEDDEEENDLDELKRKCRYRLSCYGQKGIALSAKQRERQQILLAGRIGPPKGEKKSTMKDAADAAVKKMMAKEREGKMLREKYEKDGDKVLANFWSELERKNRCKYRKSCYQSGIVPEIEQQNAIIKWLGGGGKKEENVEQKEEELAVKKFSEMDELERKMHCQYRRSCLENGGIRVNIQNELDFLRVDLGDAMRAMRKWWAELEKKKTEKKEREKVEGHHEGGEDDDEEKPFTKLECKYRKSCYESGKLPEHLQGPKVEKDPQDEHAVKVLGGKKVPTSVKELKLFCKYRKSCYVASAEAKHKEMGIDEGKIGIAGQNETIIEIEDESRRKPKPNSDSSHENVDEEEEEEIVIVPNGVGEMEEEEKKEEEEIKKEEKITSASIQMPMKFSRRRRKAVAANPKPKIMETVIKKEEVKKKIELKPKVRERKQKRYKIVDVMPMEEPVMFGVDKMEEDEGRKRKEREEEDKEMKKKEEDRDEDEDEERKVKEKEIEEKQKATRNNKKYVQEEVKKVGEEERKIWAKREVKLSSKLECRYRKSCYKSGIVPEWTAKGQKQFGLWTILMGIFEGKKGRNDELDDILAWRGMGEKERWFHCKYRKSCYERMNKKAGSELDEGKRKKKMMESAAKIAAIPSAKKEKKLAEKASNVPASSTKMVDLSTKLQCKYRKSCYEGGGGGNVPKVMERIVDSIEGGQRNWTGEGRCNPWRISCRQAMGLPIKEKAPIGPNGKRLCRKRKSPAAEENNK